MSEATMSTENGSPTYLLPALSPHRKMPLADSLRFYLYSRGFTHEVAEELSALSADLSRLHGRRSGALNRNPIAGDAMNADQERYEDAIARFDAANAEDPRSDKEADGRDVPRELLYARRMTDMIGRFTPDASEVARLAVRAQHIQRWKVPRDSYPMDRDGYLQWRTGLYRLHAETAGRLMREAGYDDGTIEKVKGAVGKRGLKVNPDTQLLEDVADLVFIEHYMLEFVGQKPDYTEDRWLEIIRKTWKKMSPAAREFALSGKVRLPGPLAPLIARAVSED
jgi:hypothetical protein